MGRSDYNWQFENPLLPIVADGLPITGVHVCVIHFWVECIQEISLVIAYSYIQYKEKGLKPYLLRQEHKMSSLLIYNLTFLFKSEGAHICKAGHWSPHQQPPYFTVFPVFS